MKLNVPLVVVGFIGTIAGCIAPSRAIQSRPEEVLPTTRTKRASNDRSEAEQTLVSFFDALSQGQYREASEYFVVPNPLTLLYTEIDPQDGAALLARACEDRSGCRFYCWSIKDVVKSSQASPTDFHFTVRFEDESGNLLVGGDNVTPRVCDPPGCSQFTYTVIKISDQFYVDGIPVFTGCWP